MSDPEVGWFVVDYGRPEYLDGVLARYTIRANEGVVAYAFEADEARLLAAAPALLQMLVKLTGYVGALPGTDDAITAFEEARAAIAKATGTEAARNASPQTDSQPNGTTQNPSTPPPQAP